MLNYPVLLFFPTTLCFLLLAAWLGVVLRKSHPLSEDEREDFAIVRAATLTLLGLIIGFSFSMAISRYDLRKNYEEAEANAIGTEYVRAGLLPVQDAVRIQTQLRKYLDLRILFYRTRDQSELQQINADTTSLQNEMWQTVQEQAVQHPTPIMSLVVAGMNDVLNSQGYTQAAWWNRIPTSAWGLLIITAFCCNLLVGYGGSRAVPSAKLLIVLPVVIAISFLLIADIDAPRGGLIHVSPQNLASLSSSLGSIK